MLSCVQSFLISLVVLFTILPAQSQYAAIKTMSDSISIERLQAHIDHLQKAGGHWSRVNFTPGNDSAVQYVFRALKKFPGLTSVSLDTFYIVSAQSPYNTKPLFNVVATLEGKKNPDNIIVIGGHIDCSGSRMGDTIWKEQWSTMKAPGADDNASGVASVIELARLLSDTTFGFSNDNTIVFAAFGAEEGGVVYSGWTYGSIHFASKAKTEGTNVIAMVSLDMIGFNDLNTMYLNIAADERSEWLGRHIVAMNDSFQLGITLNAPPFAYGRWSDHASFWDQQFPAVCIIECAPPWTGNPHYNANPYFHTPSDTLGTLNMNLEKKATQLALVSFATLSHTATGVETESNVIPTGFVLEQNFPNPFNPSTEICFRIPVSGFTLLNVFDVLGREITALVHEAKQAGTHTIRFDGNGLPGGMYFYRLTNGGRSITKKMTLVK